MFKIKKTKLDGVLQIFPSVFKDFRGEFVETYNEGLYRKNGIKIKFIEDDISISKKNVLRGIHCDNKAWKLVSCIFGKICLVVINCDEKSKNFGKWQQFLISDLNRKQILIPPKHGCSHLVLSKEAVFSYKQSEYYDPRRQKTYKWNDSVFNIKWPIKKPILSERDKIGHYVNT